MTVKEAKAKVKQAMLDYGFSEALVSRIDRSIIATVAKDYVAQKAFEAKVQA